MFMTLCSRAPGMSAARRDDAWPEGLMEATWPPSPAPVMSPRSGDEKSRMVSSSAVTGGICAEIGIAVQCQRGLVVFPGICNQREEQNFHSMGPGRSFQGLSPFVSQRGESKLSR